MLKLIPLMLISLPLLAHEIPGNEKDWLVIGLDLGVQEKTKVSLPEVSNRGSSLALKGAYTSYHERSVWDIGFGLRFDEMEQNNINVNTTAFISELGWRYRISPMLSLGPELHLLLGQDVSFSDTGTNSDDRPRSIFGGFRVSYDMVDLEDSGQRSLWRFGFRTMVDLDISERKVAYHQVLAEYAWPVRQARAVVGFKKEAFLKVDLKAANIQFVTGSTELTEASVEIVRELGRILSRHLTEWEYISLSGHTDITGDHGRNVKLSWARAKSVETALMEAGVPDPKIDTKGFGPDRPLRKGNTPEDYQINRRVELELNGDKASKELIESLNKLFKTKL